MLEWHVLRRRYDVRCLPVIALYASFGTDSLQLLESAAPFYSIFVPNRRPQAAAALQTSFP